MKAPYLEAFQGELTFNCEECKNAISQTSHSNLRGKCWECFLLNSQGDVDDIPVFPCKNLTAAHIACPNSRNGHKSGVYCDSCRDKISPGRGRLCRNAASPDVACPNGGQAGKHGFCKACTAQAALPLCLNYTNARVRCGNSLADSAGKNDLFCEGCKAFVIVATTDKRKCKNAAASDQPCSNEAAYWLTHEYHGLCTSCFQDHKASRASEADDPSLCRSCSLCPWELPQSKYCRECVLKGSSSLNLVIDAREKDLVLEMETEAASKKMPKLQKVCETGDPFSLYLPRKHSSLPAYSAEAHYLPWNHCPLCHLEVPVAERQSWDNALEAHTQSKHKLTLAQVRRLVLEDALAHGPREIPAQVMRTCLHRFRSQLTDAAFVRKPCACCSYGHLSKDLQTVRFPAIPSHKTDTLPALPDWLVDWNDDWNDAEWKKHGAAWLRAIDKCFSTETYLKVHFRKKARQEYAKERASILRKKSSPTAAEAADALLARVEVYFKNMKDDLDADAVLGPAGAEHPWVLLQAAASTVNEGTEAQAVDANLCQKCIKSLSKLPEPDKGYTHLMPRGARADGWWGGPMPVQI